MDLSSLFKSFDVHVKAIDGVRTPSLIGGIGACFSLHRTQ